MEKRSVEEIYKHYIKSLPVEERLRLIEMTVRDLRTQPAEEERQERYDWMSVRGVTPNLLDSEDAQEWVSRTRREADENREKQ